MIESKNLKTINEIYRPTEGKSRSHSKNHSQSQSHTQSHRNILNVNIFNS